jgi:RNA polymerase sigma-70 factor (ECF subfamily)
MLETRISLLERVRDPADAAAWSEFVGVYQPLLVAYLRKRGVPPDIADDIVQDVFSRLVPAMARFDLSPERGRFRTWLWQVTHNALVDWARHRDVQERAEREWAVTRDPTAVAPDSEWEELYRRRILEAVMERVRQSTQATSWSCFEGRVLHGRPGVEVAAELGVSVNAVYINASRVLARVRQECLEFLEPLDAL